MSGTSAGHSPRRTQGEKGRGGGGEGGPVPAHGPVFVVVPPVGMGHARPHRTRSELRILILGRHLLKHDGMKLSRLFHAPL